MRTLFRVVGAPGSLEARGISDESYFLLFLNNRNSDLLSGFFSLSTEAVFSGFSAFAGAVVTGAGVVAGRVCAGVALGAVPTDGAVVLFHPPVAAGATLGGPDGAAVVVMAAGDVVLGVRERVWLLVVVKFEELS